ncbi:MAG: restriction endonuclease subunit R [Sphingobacteriales bacterium UTBCD1]|jgi:hypothetical protein|nr:MAG: restriction endonuclease subunit R [Sphingobacteriales bacterium UTBCD1]
MIEVHYPKPGFKFKNEGAKKYIFDPLRKKWIVLTPEEWVRQNFIQYLLQEKKYPAAMIALEKEIQLSEVKKRFDVLVYNAQVKPYLLVECKASGVKLDDDVIQQALRYNISVPVQYIIITNGVQTFGWENSGHDLRLIKELPGWK